MGEFIKLGQFKMGKKKTKKEKLEEKVIFLEELGKTRSKELTIKATKWEKDFLKLLKELNYKVKFQVPVIVNKLKKPQLFILDFLLIDYQIFIELDGAQHFTKKGLKNDNQRTKKLRKEGYEPIRFANKQIEVFTKEQIDSIIKTKISLLKLGNVK